MTTGKHMAGGLSALSPSISPSISPLGFAIACPVSAMLVASPQFVSTATCTLDGGFVLAWIICWLVLCAGIAWVPALMHAASELTSNRIPKLDAVLFQSRWSILCLTALLLVTWLPIIVALYPGSMVNDTFNLISQYVHWREGEMMVDHHPVFDSLITGFITHRAYLMLGSWKRALFVLTLMQTVATAASFACMLAFIRRELEASPVLSLVLLVVCMLNPLFPILVATLGKDSIFSWLFVLFFIDFLRLLGKGNSLTGWGVVRLLVVAVLCCLTKKVGVYVVAPSLAFGAFACRDSRRIALSALAIAGVCALVMFAGMRMVFQYGNMRRGGRQELFSAPFQMTARYVRDYGDDVLDWERDAIDAALGYDDLADRYYPYLVDPVKRFEERTSRRGYARYMLAWLSQGLRHPDAYFQGWGALNAWWFAFQPVEPLMDSSVHIMLDESIMPLSTAERDEPFLTTSESVRSAYWAIAYTPVVGHLAFSQVMFATLLPLLTVAAATGRRGSRLWGFALVLPICLSIFLGMYLSPASESLNGSRYAQPLIYLAPLMVGLISSHWERRGADLPASAPNTGELA